jgi:nicotinamide riboside transporter PnuC
VGDGAPGGATVGGFHTLKEWTAMMIQITAFVPAVIAIYAATGAWVFSCDPSSKTVDVLRGGLLYGWVGVLFMCAQVLVFRRYGSAFF